MHTIQNITLTLLEWAFSGLLTDVEGAKMLPL